MKNRKWIIPAVCAVLLASFALGASGVISFGNGGASAGDTVIGMLVTREYLDRFDSDCQKVIVALLRNYTGLFADFQRFKEDRISTITHLDNEVVYQKLLLLSREHVLHYIPVKKMSTIYYVRPRLDIDEVLIPHVIYEDRKQRDLDRANAIIDYAYNDDECRLNKLLRYFGEEPTDTCHKCDVCMSKEQG